MSHTKEPWKVTEAPHQIVGMNGTVAKLTSLDADNARRIVACVNACAGLSNSQLEWRAAYFNQDPADITNAETA